MRDTSFDSQNFCLQLDRKVIEAATANSAELLSLITPSDNGFLNTFRIKTNNKTDLLVLAIYSWYLDENIGMLLRWSMLDKLKELDPESEKYLEVEICLRSRGLCLSWLQETSLYHTRDFFGNVLTDSRIRRCRHFFAAEFKTKRRSKRIQRHRGYRDKGSLRRASDRHELYSGTLEHQLLEKQRQVLADTVSLWEGFLLGG